MCESYIEVVEEYMHKKGKYLILESEDRCPMRHEVVSDCLID